MRCWDGRPRSNILGLPGHSLGSRNLHPSAAAGLLVVLPELVLDARVEGRRQYTSTVARAVGVATTLVAVATQVRMHSPVHLEADLMLVAGAAANLHANSVLRLVIRHRDHFFRVP